MNTKKLAAIGIMVAVLALSQSGFVLEALDWPAENATVLNNFGWNDQGQPLVGTIFEGEGPVRSAEAGELIFSRRSTDNTCPLPSPLGSWIALDHGDGIIGIYGHLEELPVSVKPETLVEKQVPLAFMGQTGWSERRGFYFSLFDRKERRWINPSMIISPFQDTRPPVIQTVRLQNAEGRLINLDPGTLSTISQGRYMVSVAAIDTLMDPNEHPLAPHRIICTVNGSETGTLSFETCSARDGILLVNRNGLAPAREVYAPFPAFEVGEIWLSRGRATLEIIAQDIMGNTRNMVFRLAVE